MPVTIADEKAHAAAIPASTRFTDNRASISHSFWSSFKIVNQDTRTRATASPCPLPLDPCDGVGRAGNQQPDQCGQAGEDGLHSEKKRDVLVPTRQHVVASLTVPRQRRQRSHQTWDSTAACSDSDSSATSSVVAGSRVRMTSTSK